MDEEKDGFLRMQMNYSPIDFFGENKKIERPDFVMEIDKGVVFIKIKNEVFESNTQVVRQSLNLVKTFFKGAQLQNGKKYVLSDPEFDRSHTKHHVLFTSPGNFKFTFGEVHFVKKDKAGNIIYDSQIEAREEQNLLISLIEDYGEADETIKKILGFFEKSIDDTEYALHHFYNIYEGLCTRFGGISNLCDTLKVSSTQIDFLKSTANAPKYKQSRHSGKCAGIQSDIQEYEIQKARSVAQYLIKAYLLFLNNNENSISSTTTYQS